MAYLAAGVVGFAITGFDHFVSNSGKDLFGFDLNGFHDLVHLGIGAILIGAAIPRQPEITEGVLIGGGLVYLLAAVLGFAGDLHQLLSIDGTFAADNFLHLGTGLAAVAGGFLGMAFPESATAAPVANT